MKALDKLLDIARQLNGPDGCPWDLTQTFESLKHYVLEEAHEVIEAVDEGDDPLLIEELGDLFYVVIFYAMVAEKESRFTLDEIITHVSDKLVRRHPHVFGEEAALSADEVIHRWEEIKKEEKPQRKSAIDGIPKTLGLLMRAQKIFSKMHKANYSVEIEGDDMGAQILRLVLKSSDAEDVVRKALTKHEKAFREWEKSHVD